MKKQIKFISALFSILLLASCGGGSDDGDGGGNPPPPDSNSAPSSVTQVTFPTANLLCIDNVINFQWTASTDPDGDSVRYRVTVATDRALNGVVEERTVTSTSTVITLQKGTAYYWNVTALDNSGAEAQPSPTLAFYTSGDAVVNYAPFTAALVAPANDSDVTAGTVNLSWTGGDTDTGDTLTYDLYFGEATDPPLLEAGLTAENFDVTTETGRSYYWRIDSIDDSGAKTIGQVWTFSTL